MSKPTQDREDEFTLFVKYFTILIVIVAIASALYYLFGGR